MKSIKEVYDQLKKYDSENNLVLDDNGESILLELNNKKIVAFDGYISATIISKGIITDKEITHWHPNDYDEIYHDLLGIMKGRKELPPPLKKMKNEMLKIYIIIIISTIPATIFGEIFNLDSSFLIFGLIIVFIILFILLIVGIKKLIILFRIRNVDKNDLKLIKKYVGMRYPPTTYAMDFYLTFDYIRDKCYEFLKYPKKIHLPYALCFCDDEIVKMKEIIKNRKSDEGSEEVYQYYLITLEVIKVIYKYYEENGYKK